MFELKNVDLVDYFSRLPESLIHHIPSFIPFKEIGRTCVLSKNWNTIWYNYPNMDFSLTSKDKNPDELWRWTDNSMSELLVRKPLIQELSLDIRGPGENSLTPKLNNWLGLAVDKNVSRLVLVTDNLSFPETVLFARTLEVLNLTQCTLEEDRNVRIELPRLEKLYLSKCHFKGDNLLQKILDACPKMESISIYKCYDVGRFLSISGKPVLTYFSFWHWDGVERIEVNAPSLHTLSYGCYDVPCAVDVSNCTCLKELLLEGFKGDNLDQVLSLFQGIQVLKYSSRKYKISCQRLEKLVLTGIDNFPRIEIDAPNMHTLEVVTLTSKQNFSCWNVPKVHTLKLSFAGNRFELACRAGLEGFLMKLHNCKDLKFIISPYGNDMILIENLHHVSFSSIDELVKKSGAKYVWISSEDETSSLAKKLVAYQPSRIDRTLHIICSCHESIKSVHEKISSLPDIQNVFRLVKLVTTDEEVENGIMDGDLKSLMGCRPYHNAKILCFKKELANKEIV